MNLKFLTNCVKYSDNVNDALYDNSEGGVDDYLSGGDSAFDEADIAKARVYHGKLQNQI